MASTRFEVVGERTHLATVDKPGLCLGRASFIPERSLCRWNPNPDFGRSEVEGINDGGSRAAAIQGGTMTKLELLYAQKSKKFDQLRILAAREFGYGEFTNLSTEDRIRVEDEATQYVEQWEETVEMKTNFTIGPISPLRRLLAEYHDICERILHEHEIDARLWAYRKEPRNADVPCHFKSPGDCEPEGNKCHADVGRQEGFSVAAG